MFDFLFVVFGLSEALSNYVNINTYDKFEPVRMIHKENIDNTSTTYYTGEYIPYELNGITVYLPYRNIFKEQSDNVHIIIVENKISITYEVLTIDKYIYTTTFDYIDQIGGSYCHFFQNGDNYSGGRIREINIYQCHIMV